MLQAQIYFDKEDLHHNEPLTDFLMRFLMDRQVAGATCFTASAGFGSNQYIKQPNLLFSFDEPPMLITFVDEDDKVINLVKALRQEFKGGLIVTTSVQIW